MQAPFFSGLSLEALKVLAYLATRESLKAGETLFSAGESDGLAVYVLAGSFQAFADDDAVEPLTSINQGQWVGGLALVGKSPRLFTLRAKEPTAYVLLTREKFAKTCEQFPEILPRYAAALAEKVLLWEKGALEARAAGKTWTGVSLI